MNLLLNRNTISSFVLRFSLLFLIWKAAFHIIWNDEIIFDIYYNLSLIIINKILFHVYICLKILGHSAEIIESTRLVKISGTIGVTVGEPCIGIDTTALFIGVILSYGNEWKKKLMYLLFGCVLIYLLNIVRITSLSILVQYNPYIWDLNHKYIFKIIIYTTILTIWIKWYNLLENQNKPKRTVMTNVICD